MGKEYRAKVFKSGNSLALRLPKDLGLTEGATMVLREEQIGFHVEPDQAPKKKIDISGFAAKALSMWPFNKKWTARCEPQPGHLYPVVR